VDVVAEEVDGLARRVYLRLVDILALSEHGGGVQDGAVLGGQQLGALQDDGGAHRPVRGGPLFVRLHGGIDGHADFLLAGLVVAGQHVALVMRAHHLGHVACADFLAPYNKRYIDDGVHLALQLRLKGDAFGRAFQIRFHRLIGRNGELYNGIFHVNVVLWGFYFLIFNF